MDIIRPLQISFNSQVLEQDRKFYFIASSTMGINLLTGEPLLDINFFKEIFEAMGDNPLPDMCMPKPNGEFLVSGKFFSKNEKPVTGGEVKVSLGDREKNLFVFGNRKWKNSLPSTPEELTSQEIDYKYAFGGKGYDKNPDGTGFNDGLLPNIENPKNLITSKNNTPEPACFSPIYPMLPQRAKYQGTYDKDYKIKYFPGYPPDHDWRFFLCAPKDQWIKDFYKGDEKFKIFNMHPELELIEGNLPGLYARCFISKEIDENLRFIEIRQNLDTIWLFPEKEIALLIFRGILEVEDDEAEAIKDILCAYEDLSQTKRSINYYEDAFNKRKTSDDEFLKNLNTKDLIPENHKSAMEILLDTAMNSEDESEFSKNIDAKADEMQKMADKEMEEAIKKTESSFQTIDMPDEVPENVLKHFKDGKPDIRALMDNGPKDKIDPDIEKLNNSMDDFLPGLSSGDPKKLDFKNFSFDKIDDLFEAVDEFSDKKEKQANEVIKEQLKKIKENSYKQLETIEIQIIQAENRTRPEDELKAKKLYETKEKIKETIDSLDSINLDEKKESVLPRFNSEEIIDEITNTKSHIDPVLMDALHHVQAMKQSGSDEKAISEIEDSVLQKIKTAKKEAEESLEDTKVLIKQGEIDFKETYIMSAHFMEKGLSPHKKDLNEIKDEFLNLFKNNEDLTNKDFACIDLEGENLEGIDLSGAYLEQVNFKNTNLKNANLKGVILSRAVLENADLSGADLTDSNIGAVKAVNANFSNAKLINVKMSKGDFSKADFSDAELEDIETIEIKIDGAKFEKTNMPNLNFLEISISGTNFLKTKMEKTAFLNCKLDNVDFRGSDLNNSAFVDTGLKNCFFNNSEISNSCFVILNPEKVEIKELEFKNSKINQTNFQNLPLINADFSYSQIKNSLFSNSDLTGANLSYCIASSAQFRKSKLINANLNNINLDMGSLAKANLANASFKDANLFSVDFLRSNISNTDFSGANLDNTLIENWRPK